MRSSSGPDKPGRVTQVRTSELLRDFANGIATPRVTIAEIETALRERGFGILIVLFAFPNAIPGPPLPGFSGVTSIPIMIFAAQLLLGWNQPALPRAILRKSVDAKNFRRIALLSARAFGWGEKILRPRFSPMTGFLAERLLAAFCLVLALVLALPIPFGNNLPGLALTLIGLGLIEQDGYANVAGVLVGLAGLGVFVLIILGFAQGTDFLMHLL